MHSTSLQPRSSTCKYKKSHKGVDWANNMSHLACEAHITCQTVMAVVQTDQDVYDSNDEKEALIQTSETLQELMATIEVCHLDIVHTHT